MTELAKRSGKSLRALAAAVGVSHSMLSQISAGKRRLSPELLDKIAHALGISAAEVLARLPRPHMDRPTGSPELAALRALHLRTAALHVRRVEVDFSVAANGDATLERRYFGCFPATGQARGELVLKARALGRNATPAQPLIEVAPGSADVQVDSRVDEPWRIHRIGFSRTDGGVLIRARDFLPRAFAAHGQDPAAAQFSPDACYAIFLPYVADELAVTITLAETPRAWSLRYWLGSGPMETSAREALPDSVGQPFEKAKIEASARASGARILSPAAGYSYAIAWTPGS